MTIYASGHVAEIEQQSRDVLSPEQQLARLVDWSSQVVSPDIAIVQSLSEQAGALVPFCDWRTTAQELCLHQSATAKWLAAALFEAGVDFLSAATALDSFSCFSSGPTEALRLLTRARMLVQGGRASDAIVPLKRAIRLSESYRSLNACGKVLKAIERAGAASYTRTCRLAMLGDATFDFLLPVMKTLAFASGIELDIYANAYNQHMQEVLDDTSRLHTFKPEVIVLAIDWRSLALPEEAEDPGATLAQKLADVTNTWNAVAARFHCHIIQHNFVIPEVSAYGGLSGRISGARANLMRQLNLQLVEAASTRSDVTILDVDEIASLIGKRTWDDPRMWIAAKSFLQPRQSDY